MSLILAAIGVLLVGAATLFSSLADSGGLSDQGMIIARLVRLPFFLVGGLAIVLAPVLVKRSGLRRRLESKVPPESQVLLPGILTLALVLVIFVLFKLAEYSSALVSHEQFWDNYLLLGRFPVRIPSEPFTPSDYLNSTFLFAAGVVALLTKASMSSFRRGAALAPSAWDLTFWTLLGIGFVYLALDEMLLFHEFMGANLGFDDGRIVLGYLGLMGLMSLVFHRKFLSIPVAAGCLAVGAAFQALGAVADRFHFWEGGFTPEEIAEMSASGLYLLAVLQYAYAEMRIIAERTSR